MKSFKDIGLSIFIVFFFILSPNKCFSQSSEENLNEYSYKEFIDLLQQEEDSIFIFENAFINFFDTTDSSFVLDRKYVYEDSIKEFTYEMIQINKEVVLRNVHFISKIASIDKRPDGRWLEQSFGGVIQNIQFNKALTITDCGNIWFYNCLFKEKLTFGTNNLEMAVSQIGEFAYTGIKFQNCSFYELSSFYINLHGEDIVDIPMDIKNCIFYIDETKYSGLTQISVFARRIGGLWFDGNTIIGNTQVAISSIENQSFSLANNHFDNAFINTKVLDQRGDRDLYIMNNIFLNYSSLEIDELITDYYIEWSQFNSKLITGNWIFSINEEEINKEELLQQYADSTRIKDEYIFELEITNLSKLFRFYKDKLAYEGSNGVYVLIKEMETKRFQYEFGLNPNFNTLFKWQINRFLKVFSNYGTEPQRAIIFSFYVILLFALIYLFFPNSWDSHGRKRIMDRYKFFIKYMKQDAGMHEVYLEEKKGDLLDYEDFKTVIEESGRAIPKFFLVTGYPLYKWAVLGTLISARWLKRFDIMSGKWTDLPPKKRLGKTILLIGAFIIALAYDLMVKILNAVMLSVNTFTTLGFGEIPIKGLPRYLAIIQGFIGWFMLTIFSVSLISQLLVN